MKLITRLFLIVVAFGFCCLISPQTADAQAFFQPPQAPKIGDVPPPNAGVWAQNQGQFLRDWTKAGRMSPPVSTQQAAPFNTPPWGVSSGW
jgi:hypothetical protein